MWSHVENSLILNRQPLISRETESSVAPVEAGEEVAAAS